MLAFGFRCIHGSSPEFCPGFVTFGSEGEGIQYFEWPEGTEQGPGNLSLRIGKGTHKDEAFSRNNFPVYKTSPGFTHSSSHTELKQSARLQLKLVNADFESGRSPPFGKAVSFGPGIENKFPGSIQQAGDDKFGRRGQHGVFDSVQVKIGKKRRRWEVAGAGAIVDKMNYLKADQIWFAKELKEQFLRDIN
jgi:hypothetical protein